MARNIFVLKEESKIQCSEPFFEHKPPMASGNFVGFPKYHKV